MKLRKTHAAALGWGFAEATLFFIVPDVLLSWVALKDGRKALIACLWALAGALLGGTLIWWFGQTSPDTVRSVFVSIPAIGDAMIADVARQLENDGLAALFIGPLTGTPYKVYALEAGHLGFGLLEFIAVSIPARLMRFVIVVALFVACGRLLRKFLELSTVRIVHVAAWSGFYAFYFYVMS